MISFIHYLAEKTAKGNYLSIGVDGSIPLPSFSTKTGTEVPLNEQHATLIYSKSSSLDPVSLLQKIESKFPQEITAAAISFAAFDSIPKEGERDENKATLVVALESEDLVRIHEFLKEAGCEHSYPDYSPHVSLFYDMDRDECHALVKDLNSKPIKANVRLSGYKSETIKEDWSKDL